MIEDFRGRLSDRVGDRSALPIRDADVIRERLGPYLTETRGTDTVVAQVERISVGHSRAMFRVDCADGGRYVLRMEQGGVFGTSAPRSSP